MNNKLYRVIGCIPMIAGAATTTPNRHGLVIILSPVKAAGLLNTERNSSINVWGPYKDADQAFKADPLFTSAMEAQGNSLPANYDWDQSDINITSTPELTPEEFKTLLGAKVEGNVETHFVQLYEVAGKAKDARRVEYTAFVPEGQTASNVFNQHGHPILQTPESIAEAKALLQEIQTNNAEGRVERKALRTGIAAPQRKVGTMKDEAAEAMK